jgi:ATP-dependent DNA ligase
VAFDVLNVEGADVRGLPLKDSRAVLDRIAERYRMQKSDLFFACGRSLFNAVCEFDLEGIIAKRLNDRYEPDRTKWWKILNQNYSQGRPPPSCSSGSTHRTVPLGHSRFT